MQHLHKGFTIIEATIAIFILTIGVGGVFALITRTISTGTDVKTRLEAAYLAQEGIEIVRNFRDENFLAIRKGQCNPVENPDCWKKGSVDLTVCAPNVGCEADYDDASFSSPYGSGRFLSIDSNGFYSYNSGAASGYKRKITIDAPQADKDKLIVDVEVSWSKGSVKASTELYNWLEIAPPFRSNGQPAGTLPAGTTSTTISLDTDQNATCRYTTDSNPATHRYTRMPNSFSTTGGKTHEENVSGLGNGQTYTYYVRCSGNFFNININDYIIQFNIAAPQ